MMNVICGTNKYQLEDIIEKYNGMLYRLAIIRMQNKEDAEEVVQDTFMKLIEHIQKGKNFNDEEHLKAWLLTVATNRGKSILTLYWNKNTEGMDGLKDFAAPEQKDNYAYDYVLKLPEKYKVAIYLFYYEQLTTEQISIIMKTKESTVRSYLHRGREKLQIMMEAETHVG
jgi:RNA polymerase sigma-70 factor (ECF subfamily)